MIPINRNITHGRMERNIHASALPRRTQAGKNPIIATGKTNEVKATIAFGKIVCGYFPNCSILSKISGILEFAIHLNEIADIKSAIPPITRSPDRNRAKKVIH